jgi:hypothetical protein
MQPVIARPEIEEAAEALKQLLIQYCGGSISIHYLDDRNRAVEVSF